MKKLISLAILASFIFSYTVPVFAIETAGKQETCTAKSSKKGSKITPVKNKYEYVNLEWWENFNDEILNDYIIRAVENNKDLKMATLTVDEFYQNVVMQRSAELPAISAGFLPGYGNMGKHTNENFALPIIASYELDILGKNHNKTTSVKKLYEASILDERAAYISVAAAVGSTYLNIVRMDSMVDLQEDIVSLRKEIYEMMTVSNAEGIASASDLVQANKAYVAAVTELTEYKKQRTKLLHALAVLVGDSPNNIEEYKRTDYRNTDFAGIIPEYVPSEVIVQRPDYIKAEKLLEKAGIDVKIARKECLPSINLGGGVLFKSTQIGSLFTTSDMLWGMGGGVLSTLFAGGSILANLKSKKIAYERTLRNYEKTNLTSMQEVNDSLVTVNRDEEKLAKQKEIQSLEQKDFELSKLKYQEGVISKLELNQHQENLMSVNKLVYASKFDCFVDYISFYKSVGGVLHT